MGAGAQRWWSSPGPFAVAVPSDWNPTKSHEGYARLVIGGVDCGSAVTDVAQQWAKEINAAQGLRILHLEAELERLRRERVRVDEQLDAGRVLEALSDALLAEFRRRGPSLEYEFTRRDERLAAYRAEYMNDFGGPRCALPGCRNGPASRRRDLPRDPQYCAAHRRLDHIEEHIDDLVNEHAPQVVVDDWRHRRDQLMQRYTTEFGVGQRITARGPLPEPRWRRMNQGIPRRTCVICSHPGDHGGDAHSATGFLGVQDLGEGQGSPPRYELRAWLFRDRTEYFRRDARVGYGEWELSHVDRRPNNAHPDYNRGRTATQVAAERSEAVQRFVARLADVELAPFQQRMLDALERNPRGAMRITNVRGGGDTDGEVLMFGTPSRPAPYPPELTRSDGAGRDRADAMALVFAGSRRSGKTEAMREAVDELVGQAKSAGIEVARCARRNCTAAVTRGSHCAIHQPLGRKTRR